MLHDSKWVSKKIVQNSNGKSDQDQENINIDQALKEGSKQNSYPEQVNDAQEIEVFETDAKGD